jgi:hypothetical protein
MEEREEKDHSLKSKILKIFKTLTIIKIFLKTINLKRRVQLIFAH